MDWSEMDGLTARFPTHPERAPQKRAPQKRAPIEVKGKLEQERILNEMKPVELLMVDDDDLDYELFQRQLEKQKIANVVHHAADGEKALTFLNAWYEKPQDTSLIVLLDINMPRLNGLECLKKIRSSELLRPTVVFMLTTSRSDEDVLSAYGLNIAGYLVKNDMGPAFVEAIGLLESYWRLVELPGE